jgi:hypothetical protein
MLVAGQGPQQISFDLQQTFIMLLLSHLLFWSKTTWSWQLTSSYCRGHENVNLFIHSPLCLHGIVLKELSTGTTLSLPLLMVGRKWNGGCTWDQNLGFTLYKSTVLYSFATRPLHLTHHLIVISMGKHKKTYSLFSIYFPLNPLLLKFPNHMSCLLFVMEDQALHSAHNSAWFEHMKRYI